MTQKTKTIWKQVLEIGQIVVWIGAIMFGIWATASAVGQIIGTINAHGTEILQNQSQLDDHEQRLRNVERDMQQVVTDVRWIRETLEKDQRPQ